MAKKSQPMTEEQRKKYNLVQKLNKRIRDTVKRIGAQNKVVQFWENKLQLPDFATVTAYDENENPYMLLSRSAEDLAKMNLSELERIAKTTYTWSETKKHLIIGMNKEKKAGEKFTRDDPPTVSEMRKYAEMHYEVARMFEENADLFYMLINETGWDDIREHSFEEIFEELKKINPKEYTWQRGDEIIHKADIGEEYKARRDKKQEAMNAALQRAYFD